jgi:hypothetical protein
LIPTGEQSSLLTHIAAMESVSLCADLLKQSSNGASDDNACEQEAV